MNVYMQWHRKVLKIGGSDYIKNDPQNSQQKITEMSTREEVREGVCPLSRRVQKPLKKYDSWLMKPHGRT